MVTKQAAEKLAQDYYLVGQELAMQEAGLIKEANRMGSLAKMLGVGAGGVGAAGALKHMNPELLAKLLKPGEVMAQKGGVGADAVMKYLNMFNKNLL